MDDHDIIEVLDPLIVTCRDVELVLRRCAERARSPALRAFLATRANEWAGAADELLRVGLQRGGAPHGFERSGSARGALERMWLALKGALAGPDDRAALEHCALAEAGAHERYRVVLDEPLPARLRECVERQYLGVLRTQTRVRAWRERGCAAAA